MKHDDLCQDDSIEINGRCLGCEAVKVIREDTAYRIEAEIKDRHMAVSEDVLMIIKHWQGEN